MECFTYTKKGELVKKPKKRYETMYEAQMVANNFNNSPRVFIKRVAYQCKKCKFFHVGTSLELIEGKNKKPKKDQFRSLRIKVVGTIDLKQFEKKPKKTKPVSNTIVIKKDKRKKRIRPLVGELFYHGFSYRYYMKKKTLKVILHDGRVKFIKHKKISEETLTRYLINNFLEKNYSKL